MNGSSSRNRRRALHTAGGWVALASLSLAALPFAGLSCSAGGAKADLASVGGPVVPGPVTGAGGSINTGGGSLLPDEGPDFGAEIAPPKGTFTGIPECEACTDFPLQPIFEDGLGPEVAGVFSQASSGTPPCIVEPSDGMLVPANMLRPRVRFSGSTAQGSVHQITVHTPREVNDLVVYTTQNPWLIPPEIWTGLSKNVFEEDITITLKTSVGNAAPSESRVNFRIAPVQAGGSMVYWAATTEQPGLDTTRLMAFSTLLVRKSSKATLRTGSENRSRSKLFSSVLIRISEGGAKGSRCTLSTERVKEPKSWEPERSL